MHRHPGIERLLLEACEEYDATSSFEDIGHTNEARRILHSLVIPGLESVPYNVHLCTLRGRAERRQLLEWVWASSYQMVRLFVMWVVPVGLALHRCSFAWARIPPRWNLSYD